MPCRLWMANNLMKNTFYIANQHFPRLTDNKRNSRKWSDIRTPRKDAISTSKTSPTQLPQNSWKTSSPSSEPLKVSDSSPRKERLSTLSSASSHQRKPQRQRMNPTSRSSTVNSSTLITMKSKKSDNNNTKKCMIRLDSRTTRNLLPMYQNWWADQRSMPFSTNWLPWSSQDSNKTKETRTTDKEDRDKEDKVATEVVQDNNQDQTCKVDQCSQVSSIPDSSST